MYHDGTLAGIAVLTGAEPVQPQGVAMLAQIGFCGAIDAPRELWRELSWLEKRSGQFTGVAPWLTQV